jgi:hypothetical protein
MSIRTRVQRWQRAGVLPKILDAAAPPIERISIDFQDRLHELSPWGRNWQFGRKKDDPAFRNLPRR